MDDNDIQMKNSMENEIEPTIFDKVYPKKFQKFLAKKIYIKGYKDTYYLQNWHIIHFITGIILGYLVLALDKKLSAFEYYVKLLLVHTIWESFQVLVGITPIHPRVIPDILIDTVSFMIGVWIIRKIMVRYSYGWF